jgi:hypothetical protein
MSIMTFVRSTHEPLYSELQYVSNLAQYTGCIQCNAVISSYGWQWESLKERDQLEEDVDGWIILIWILHRMEWYGLD